jgi:hypothetical protein
LVQETKAFHDPMVKVDEFCLGEFIDIDLRHWSQILPCHS